ncbi:MAG: FlaD/FlaE family flagellar protein [Methanobacteriota archaeon]
MGLFRKPSDAPAAAPAAGSGSPSGNGSGAPPAPGRSALTAHGSGAGPAAAPAPPAQAQPPAAAPPQAQPAPAAPPAAPPASPPAAAPVAAPPGDEKAMKDLQERLLLMQRGLDTEREAVKGFTEKVGKMEERMKFLQNLSEVLSAKYSPFVGDDAEEEPFEPDPLKAVPARATPPSRAPPAAPPTAAPEPAPAPAPVAEAAAASPIPITKRGTSDPLGEAGGPPPTDQNGRGDNHRQPPGALVGNGPVPSIVRAGTRGAWRVDVTPEPAFGKRESYVVLSWFDHLLATLEPATLYRFLDYYRDTGWITEEAYAWMLRLAAGIAERDEAAIARLPPPDPREVLRLHRTSLRVLDFLYGQDLADPELRELDHQLRARLSDGG